LHQGLVAAHEVGHGLFQLRHTFDYSGIKQGALPDNLMDYSAGNQLSKLQWDLIHDPGLVFGLFETDKGAQMAGGWAISPDFKYFISVPSVNEVAVYKNTTGTLSGFVINEVKYIWDESLSEYINEYTGKAYENIKKKEIGKGLADTDMLYLFYDLEKGCNGGTYSLLSYAEFKTQTKKVSIDSYIVGNQLNKISLPCISGDKAVNKSFNIITSDKDTTVLGFLRKLKTVYDKLSAFYNNCAEQNWQPGKLPGIVPECFWKDINIKEFLYYTSADLAYNAGIIDGAYSEATGIIEVTDLLLSGKLKEKFKDIAYAYTLAYLQCYNITLTAQEYRELMAKLVLAQQNQGVLAWLQENYYEPQVNYLENKLKKCTDASQLRQNIAEGLDKLVESIDSFEDIGNICNNLVQRLKKYYALITSNTNQGRYQVGRLIIPVLSTVIPGVGVAGKTTKTKTVLKSIEELSQSQIDELTEKLIAKGKVAGAGKIFTTAELQLLKRSDLADFVKNNLDDLLTDANRKAIWDLTDYCPTCQFQRGDMIEEIFNQWKYKNALNLNDLKKNFPKADFDGFGEMGKELISLKTYQPKLATEKTLKGITDKIDEYADSFSKAKASDLAEKAKKPIDYFDNHNRVLDFVIQKGEWDNFFDDINNIATKLSKKYNINIIITEF